MIFRSQGRSQELEMGGATLLDEGSGGRLRPPVGPGQSPGRGACGTPPPPGYGLGRVIFPNFNIYKIIHD